MIESVSSSTIVSAIQRPQLPQEAKVDAVSAALRKGGTDTAEFSSAALRQLAGETEGG